MAFKIDRAATSTSSTPKRRSTPRRRVGDTPVYLSIDIDVLDPASAPATGTPTGGFTARELLPCSDNWSGLETCAPTW